MPVPRLTLDAAPDISVVASEQRISADSHFGEPPDLWEKRLPQKFQDPGLHFPGVELYGPTHHLRAGGWDPQERLRDQAYDGISAEVLYPTLGYQAYRTGDPALEEACTCVYNDWLIEFCSVAPERFWGLALISLWDIDHAVAEVERCKRAGLRGVTIGLVPAPELPYSSEHYERFWAICADLGMSVNLHINNGPGFAKLRSSGRAGLMPDGVHKFDMLNALGNLVVAGVLDRYPSLKIVFAEGGVGWLPFFAQELDYYKNRFAGKAQAMPRLPSEYIYRQVYGAFINDEVGSYLLGRYGQDNFMWSNDYPHGASSWPKSATAIAQDLGYLPPEIRWKIICGTAAKVYNDGELPPPADPPGEIQDLTSWETHFED
jgi:predicted TIM-barrel fold metal-dependent hydrolase